MIQKKKEERSKFKLYNDIHAYKEHKLLHIYIKMRERKIMEINNNNNKNKSTKRTYK